MAAAAGVAAAQVRVRAELAEIAAALDAVEGSAEHGLHVRSLAAEVALVEQVGQSVAEGLLQEAATAVREFPGLVDALGAGAVSEAQLRVLTEAGLSVSHVDAVEQTARRGAFVRVMLAEVGARVLPPRALRVAAARVAESLTQESVCERFARARKTRYVSVTEAENGMCLLRARLPLIEGKAIADRLRKQAKAVIRARPAPTGSTGRAGSVGSAGDTQSAGNTQSTGNTGSSESAASGARAEGADTARDEGPVGGLDEAPDERTVDQVKADLFADVLLTSTPTSNVAAAGIQASVQFTIPILTLLGSGHALAPDTDRLIPAPALLNGMSPIPLEEAKRLAANAPSFQRILTHPITGAVAAVDTYRPTAAMRAFLTARDIHCRWPGCRQPAARCDLDHTHAWEHGGTTSIDNLCGLCRGHHVMKHATAWTVRQLGGGVLEWRTPSGKKYADRPEHHDTYANPNIEFRPSDEARDGRAATGMAMPRPTSQQNSNAKAPAPDEPEQRGSAGEPPPF
nr:HNH endonuclease signature motif containing protein [Pseudoclavibacter sp. RFBG4]